MNLQLVLSHHRLDRMHAEELDLHKSNGKWHSDGGTGHEVALKFKRSMQHLAGIAFDLSLSLFLLLGLSLSLNEALYVLGEVFRVEVLCTGFTVLFHKLLTLRFERKHAAS